MYYLLQLDGDIFTMPYPLELKNLSGNPYVYYEYLSIPEKALSGWHSKDWKRGPGRLIINRSHVLTLLGYYPFLSRPQRKISYAPIRSFHLIWIPRTFRIVRTIATTSLNLYSTLYKRLALMGVHAFQCHLFIPSTISSSKTKGWLQRV